MVLEPLVFLSAISCPKEKGRYKEKQKNI